ncbi:MAG: diacylglycerol kinase family lipid kinase [Bacteroidales bacterium]|nr:diacylglycerol kinase family lipid kinase [Bacteroidales bacterium]
MKRVLAVVNPIAGKKKKIRPEDIVSKILAGKVEIEWLYWTSPLMDIGKALVTQLEQSHFDVVVVFGGDGTVNRVAQVLMYRPEALCIIPMGSGNGLARHLHIPMNYEKALQLVLNGYIKTIDGAKMNEIIYFCTAGLGFDAWIAYKFAHAGTRGLMTYVKMVLNEFFKYQSKSYQLKFNQDQRQLKAFFITVANANQWGNNVKVAPQAKIDDGQLEVTILKPFKWIELPLLLISLFFNRFHRSFKVYSISASQFQIVTNEPENYAHFDGEPLIIEPNIHFICLPNALKVCVPKE